MTLIDELRALLTAEATPIQAPQALDPLGLGGDVDPLATENARAAEDWIEALLRGATDADLAAAAQADDAAGDAARQEQARRLG